MKNIIQAIRAALLQRSYRKAQRIMLDMGRQHGGEWNEWVGITRHGEVAESLGMADGIVWAMTQSRAVDIHSARQLMAYVRAGGDGAVMIG